MKPKLPNIVLMVLDTVGARHLSLYGYHRDTTPEMARLAQECTVYTRATAPACWTTPSHASLFTGLYPSQHGAHEGSMILGQGVRHLGPALKQAGYRTYGISANFLVTPATGLCQGFDHFTEFSSRLLQRLMDVPVGRENGEYSRRLADCGSLGEKLRLTAGYIRQTGRWPEVAARLGRTAKERLRSGLDFYLGLSPFGHSAPFTEKTVDLMAQRLQDHARLSPAPYFLFVNFMEAHQYYRPPRRQRRYSRWRDKQWEGIGDFYAMPPGAAVQARLDTLINLYDDELRYLDEVMGRIWRFLRQLPDFDNTVVIITSDHGEHFGEKQHFGHMLSLYQDLIWVPLIIKYPRGSQATGSDDRLASLTDLFATLLDLARSPLPRPETSWSLLSGEMRPYAVSQIVYPEIWQAAWQEREAFLKPETGLESPPLSAVLMAGGQKVIAGLDGALEVYHLGWDPEETTDLAGQITPAQRANLKALVAGINEELGLDQERDAITLDRHGLAAALNTLQHYF